MIDRFRELVSYFMSTVGAERSEELLRAKAAELGLDPAALEDSDVDAILDALSKSPGIIGVTARFAAGRRARRAASSSFHASFDPHPPSSGVTTSSRDVDRVRIDELEALLSASMDPVQAGRVLREYWSREGLVGTTCSRANAIAILEAMAASDGVVGIAGRFAKARWHLMKGHPGRTG